MTPLIDIIFLLLLFFMLTSTFSEFSELELSSATTGQASSVEPANRAFVRLGADRLLLNGAPVELEDLIAQLSEGQVLISLDDSVTAQHVVDLLVRLRKRDDLSVTVLE